MSLILPFLGVAVLVLVGVDVFITVFHPEGHGGPLTRRQTNLLWKAWRALAPREEGRERWLAFGGPVLAVMTPAVWAFLLVVAFALIYYPWMERFLVSPGSLRAHWVEALYYSGFAAATLGTGDIVPDQPALRLLTVVEAISGFALVTAGLSYILAIYRENGRKATLASDLALHFSPDDAAPPSHSPGDAWLEQVARELLHVTLAHAQYPILHYFRPVDPRNSLALQMRPLVPRSGRGRAGTGSEPRGLALAVRAVDRYLTAADERFVAGSLPRRQREPDMEQRYLRMLEYLGYPPETRREAV